MSAALMIMIIVFIYGHMTTAFYSNYLMDDTFQFIND